MLGFNLRVLGFRLGGLGCRLRVLGFEVVTRPVRLLSTLWHSLLLPHLRGSGCKVWGLGVLVQGLGWVV